MPPTPSRAGCGRIIGHWAGICPRRSSEPKLSRTPLEMPFTTLSIWPRLAMSLFPETTPSSHSSRFRREGTLIRRRTRESRRGSTAICRHVWRERGRQASGSARRIANGGARWQLRPIRRRISKQTIILSSPLRFGWRLSSKHCGTSRLTFRETTRVTISMSLPTAREIWIIILVAVLPQLWPK